MGCIKVETAAASCPDAGFDTVRSLLILKQFDDVCRMAEGICRLVPLKGIGLLTSLYREGMDRAVGDLDLLVVPAERLEMLVARMQAEGYVLQFDFLLNASARAVKRKVALRSPCPERLVDLDLHTAFVTKKFFARTVGTFNEDALARCRRDGPVVCRMDSVDEWLFLAQHACFHRYREEKWCRDLMLLQAEWTHAQRRMLCERMRRYGFRRVTHATLLQLRRLYGSDGVPLAWSPPASPLWKRFIEAYDPSDEGALTRRIVRPFWEFLFIDRFRDRFRAWLRLFAPSCALLQNIYRTDAAVLAAMLYPLHFFLTFLGFILFRTVFYGRAVASMLSSNRAKEQ